MWLLIYVGVAPASLAVSAIDKIVDVKDLINGIVKGAEEILNSDVFSSVRRL